MNLQELIITWKKQDSHIEKQLRNVTMQYLFREKSKSVLKDIHNSLMWELSIIILATISFDVLFFLVDISFTPLRFICFGIFNLTAFFYIFFYQAGVSKSKLNYRDDLETNLQKIIHGLTQFRGQCKLVNIPIVFVCILMFAGSQDLFVLIPWFILEFLLWRSMLLPRMRSRFSEYTSDLEYTLKQIHESKDRGECS